VSSMMTII